MSSIADALKRAQQERERLQPRNPERGAEPTQADAPEPSLAAAILGGEQRADAAAAVPESPAPSDAGLASILQPRRAESRSGIPPLASPAPAPSKHHAPPTTLTTAVQQAPAAIPPAIRRQQQATATIVEDYASKRRLNLPPSLVVYHDRSGPIAEQYRRMRDALMAGNPKRECQALVVTSSRGGEGKTITTLNLGLSLAEVRANRVLLVDGCLQAPSRSSSLSALLHVAGAPGGRGLAEILAAPAGEELEKYLRATPWNNLYVLPAGAPVAPATAVNLLQSPNLPALLRRVRPSFQWILIDAPSALLPDAGLLGMAADGMLLTVALHHSRSDHVQATIRRLRSMNLPLKSCILTRA